MNRFLQPFPAFFATGRVPLPLIVIFKSLFLVHENTNTILIDTAKQKVHIGWAGSLLQLLQIPQ